jgi:hypothetical protein
MKTLLASLAVLATLLAAGCASTDGVGDPLQAKMTHPGPMTEMTRGACCLKPSDPSQ